MSMCYEVNNNCIAMIQAKVPIAMSGLYNRKYNEDGEVGYVPAFIHDCDGDGYFIPPYVQTPVYKYECDEDGYDVPVKVHISAYNEDGYGVIVPTPTHKRDKACVSYEQCGVTLNGRS